MEKDFVSTNNIPTLELKKPRTIEVIYGLDHLLRKIHPPGPLYIENTVSYRAVPFLYHQTLLPPCFGNFKATKTQRHLRIQEKHYLLQIQVLHSKLQRQQPTYPMLI